MANENLFGQKIIRLKELKEKGFKVPEFVAVSADELKHPDYRAIAKRVREALKVSHYAVRSASFSEDGNKHSQAGQFLTKLRVLPENLEKAIEEVHQSSSDDFSLFIQEYLEANYGGVLFTRNPFGYNEMVLEWAKGGAEEVVSGTNSNKLVFSTTNPLSKEPFRGFKDLIIQAKRIETEYRFPQDIEWTYVKDTLYILQTRPITSLTHKQWKGFQYLDEQKWPKEYYYDTETLEDTFFEAYPLAKGILERFHVKDGAVSRAYAALGINYSPKRHFIQLGNSLYVDQEASIKQYFPAYSYFGKAFLTPHFASLRGSLTSVKNIFALAAIRTDTSEVYYEKLVKHVEMIKQAFAKETSFKEWLTLANTVYADVFAINITAQKALKSGQDKMYVKKEESLLKGFESKLSGNSINIADESPFIAHEDFSNANAFEALREQGRWLSVMCFSGMRESLGEQKDLLYFATVDEVINGTFDLTTLQKRKASFSLNKEMQLPKKLASLAIPVSNSVFGVSKGVAEGVLTSAGESLSTETILLVDQLNPELTRYFYKVKGIISRQGGILSHLAIMAREYHIPIVIDKRPTSPLVVGRRVKIDGEKGTIEFIQ